MAQTHTVKQGEHLSRIASQYGFYDWNIIWDHPSNATLKGKRNLNILFPGDEVFIPDKTPKTVPGNTTLVHTFYLNDQSLKLQITLRNWDGSAVVNAPCELEVDGASSPLKSDGKGQIFKSIKKTATQGSVKITTPEALLQFQIGCLDPETEDTGWRARLANLGYSSRLAEQDQDRMRLAIEEFQCENGLTVNGRMDQATKAKLKEVHGC